MATYVTRSFLSVLVTKQTVYCQRESFLSNRSIISRLTNFAVKRQFTTSRTFKSQQNGDGSQSSESSVFGHLLLIMPAAAFGLGTWQIQRRKWKLNLIQELEDKTNAEPIPLPEDLTELAQLEYRKINVRGEFDHSKELYILPRSLNNHGKQGTGVGFETGVHVITPFYVADKGIWILVNRGWVSRTRVKPTTREEGQVEGTVNLTGVLRLTEQRAPFIPQNDKVKNRWHYRDMEEMSKVTGTEPIMIDAVYDSTMKGGPIGGQTRVSLRNEHMQYIITWYSLAILTGVMWYYGIFKKRRNFLHRPKSI